MHVFEDFNHGDAVKTAALERKTFAPSPDARNTAGH
jgi:hypothetical protein